MSKRKIAISILVATSLLLVIPFLTRETVFVVGAVTKLLPQTTQQRIVQGKPLKPNSTHRPPKGYVPDEATAVKIAEAVLSPIYGEEHIKNEKPFKARLVDGVWIVNGTLKQQAVGGTAYAEISKETGTILNVTHFK